jgi:hypothetical protein
VVYVIPNLDEFRLSIWSNVLVPNRNFWTQTGHPDDLHDAKHLRDAQRLGLLKMSRSPVVEHVSSAQMRRSGPTPREERPPAIAMGSKKVRETFADLRATSRSRRTSGLRPHFLWAEGAFNKTLWVSECGEQDLVSLARRKTFR